MVAVAEAEVEMNLMGEERGSSLGMSQEMRQRMEKQQKERSSN